MTSLDMIDESAIVDALRLGEGSDRATKILNLQGRGLWHGDLAEMRGDSPRREAVVEAPPSAYALEAMARMATIRRFRAALNRLSPRSREALRLHYDEELPVAEIAERLGVSTRFAEKLIQRSLQRLLEISGAASDKHDRQ